MRVSTGISLALCTIAVAGLTAVYSGVRQCADEVRAIQSSTSEHQVRDRTGRPLTSSFTGSWNTTDQKPLHAIPPLIQQAFLLAEDQRFYTHSGPDWLARIHAVWQNLQSLSVVRGASTITEQVVRMLHPRARSLRARLIEGIEAHRLELQVSKATIFEFYLNQVPFARQRRGIVQAARLYFDRDLETLSQREMLALAVLVRAPDRFDLLKNSTAVDLRVASLARRLLKSGAIHGSEYEQITREKLELSRGGHSTIAPHFARYVRDTAEPSLTTRPLISTIDPHIQRISQNILESRVADLAPLRVSDGALLVVDAQSAEVLAWVNAGPVSAERGSHIDAVTSPRQPGSTLKPFLYALALSRGWNAATVINDSPLAEPVGAGLHTYRNYSRMHYGKLSLREALGNSLNIPAIKTIQFTGKDEFLSFLKLAGFNSLTQPAEHYGEGLALGNGEVTLFELTQAYAALANHGLWRPLRLLREQGADTLESRSRRVLSPEITSIISNILADPYARRLEFGSDGVLRLPVQTAVKTGTSTEYRDAWALGYSHNFVVGVWLGNLDNSPMREISGARGPALVLRSIFAHLESLKEPRDLFVSPRLHHRTICPRSGLLSGPTCPRINELFVSDSEPRTVCTLPHDSPASVALEAANERRDEVEQTSRVRIALPSPGLNLARDPRIPDSHEVFGFELESPSELKEVTWFVDGRPVAHYTGDSRRHLWPLEPGRHTVRARALRVGANILDETDDVEFFVR